MTEVWVLEQLKSVRDLARAGAMYRLAEHLDDAMLLAASEYHEAQFAADFGRVSDDGKGSGTGRAFGGRELH